MRVDYGTISFAVFLGRRRDTAQDMATPSQQLAHRLIESPRERTVSPFCTTFSHSPLQRSGPTVLRHAAST
jgi:hypothetical protein